MSDLTPLSGAPMALIIVGNQVRDLALLRGMPLKYCTVTGPGDFDLSTLAQAPLIYLDVSTAGVVDLSVVPTTIATLHLSGVGLRRPADLARVKAVELALSGYGGGRVIDLAHCDASRLERLDISHCETPRLWRSLAAFRASPTLTTVTTRGQKQTAAEFWAQYKPDAVR